MKQAFFIISLLFCVGWSFADWSDAISQEEQKVQDEKVKILNENFKLEKFSYTGDFENFLVDKLYDKILQNCQPYFYPLYRNEPLLKGFAQSSLKGENINSYIEYGKTNLQKENVDEPEILKLTQNYIAYYNKANGEVYILHSPLNNGKIDLNAVKIIDTIEVPSVIYRNSVKLFFIEDQLIIIGTRYSKAFGGTVTDLVFYRILNGKAKFLRLYETRGSFKDARITNNKVYLVTDYNFGAVARRICSFYVYEPLKSKINQLNLQFFKAKTASEKKKIRQSIQNIYKNALHNLDKAKILKQLKKYVKSKSYDIIFDKNAKLKVNGKVYPLKFRIVNTPFKNILYTPTNLDDLNPNTLRFSVVNIVDLNTGLNPNLYVFFGNIVNGQIHMTTKSLYLVNTYYENTSWKCRPGLYCILPIFPRGQFTLIHKLALSGFNLKYVNSQIVPGSPINQYSMDEDNNGNFRIFTQHYYPNRATNLYVFDKNLKLVGKLENIAPKEEFKSSRFIDDKAYLVTFKATDPLFVIDLKNLSKPRILGELKIPGYSLYLHPLEKVGNTQYLLGIGQQAEEIHGNWSLPKNIKIDVYKIDYSSLRLEEGKEIGKDNLGQGRSKDSYHKIRVEQLYSYVLGNEEKAGNGGSYTPVFDNPRVFSLRLEEGLEEVGRDKNSLRAEHESKNVVRKKTFTVLLPVYLAEDKVEKRCYPIYKYKNGERILLKNNCYEYTKKVPYFVGIKGLKINFKKGISEVLSKNYLDLYKRAGISLTLWQYKNENHRVSYYKNGDEFVPFEINENFADFFKLAEDKFIPFSKLFKQQIKINPKCYYKKPLSGSVTCQLYCGKRWVVENGKCVQIQVNAACSCPGFDTKSQCEKECLK